MASLKRSSFGFGLVFAVQTNVGESTRVLESSELSDSKTLFLPLAVTRCDVLCSQNDCSGCLYALCSKRFAGDEAIWTAELLLIGVVTIMVWSFVLVADNEDRGEIVSWRAGCFFAANVRVSVDILETGFRFGADSGELRRTALSRDGEWPVLGVGQRCLIPTFPNVAVFEVPCLSVCPERLVRDCWLGRF